MHCSAGVCGWISLDEISDETWADTEHCETGDQCSMLKLSSVEERLSKESLIIS